MRNVFTTTDFNTITVLCYFDHKIEAINKENPKKVRFCFKKSKNLEIILSKFWKKELSVEPMAFFSLIKEIKSRIYEN